MAEVASLSIEQGIGILQIDLPPVNALGIAVRRGLADGLAALFKDDSVKALVLICAGRTFFAGADISEFGRPAESPNLHELFDLIEGAPKPIVAAIHGTALGGGLELALVCHYRIAVPSAKVGLPEVHLGVLPGAGGTQRLPRIVGVENALDLIVSGRQVGATEALKLGILDALGEEGQLRRDAVALAAKVVAEGRPLTAVRDRSDKITGIDPSIFADFRKKNARLLHGFKAPELIVQAIEAAVSLPFEKAMARERELFRQLEQSTESLAQRHTFFAEREASKVPGLSKDLQELPVGTVAVIGAGTMGGGIAMNFLNAGIPVTIAEMNQEALDRGVGVIRRNYENSAKKGKLTEQQVEERMNLLSPTLGLEALSEADLIIEAVFEEMGIKKDVFGKLDRIAKPGAILASNTSFLDVDEIASATSRPESVIGLHFFSPANVMRLLEVVRGEKTSDALVATGMKLAKKIAKVPVLSRVCFGFIANRIMAQRSVQASAMILEGATPPEVDKVLTDYGFAMGEFAMMDLIGLDVIGRGITERTVVGDLVKLDRLGQKKNGGYYDYDEKRNRQLSPIATQVIEDVARSKGIERKPAPEASEMLGRLLYPIVNEGAKLLEEGIALRASDIDIAAVLGYNWPVYRGGPMFWADTIGLAKVVEDMEKLQSIHGDIFAPAALLRKLAAEGKTFTGK